MEIENIEIGNWKYRNWKLENIGDKSSYDMVFIFQIWSANVDINRIARHASARCVGVKLRVENAIQNVAVQTTAKTSRR